LEEILKRVQDRKERSAQRQLFSLSSRANEMSVATSTFKRYKKMRDKIALLQKTLHLLSQGKECATTTSLFHLEAKPWWSLLKGDFKRFLF
jgi:hypothetical protein